FIVLYPPPRVPSLFPYTTLFRSCSCTKVPEDGWPGCGNICERISTRTAPAGIDGACVIACQGAAKLGLDTTGGWPRSLLRAIRKDRKSTRLNSSHVSISYAVFCL